ESLSHFGVQATVIEAVQGPTVTSFELTVGQGTKVSRVRNLTDDLKLALAARDIRIQAPIPGKSSIGIEIPNKIARPVRISEVIQSTSFQQSTSPMEAVLGLGLTGEPVTLDLRKMPHGLIAGATGSGKSVCINSILVSLLYKASPVDVKMMLIDPKMVELAPYNGIPHLISPVITDVKAATAALKWAVQEMERRYELLAHAGVRNIEAFNKQADEHRQFAQKMPYLLIVIDELADLMMMAPADVEISISRIAQKARACGIHLIIATQRPSVDVITGIIKANIPTRIAFSVSSQVRSDEHRQIAQKMPYLLIVIDELADLMMMAPADVEISISRIAQKARACGIHLIIATQRPSVDVITGIIKANIPTRIAFSVSSQVDSRTMIDTNGAERS